MECIALCCRKHAKPGHHFCRDCWDRVPSALRKEWMTACREHGLAHHEVARISSICDGHLKMEMMSDLAGGLMTPEEVSEKYGDGGNRP